MGKRPTTLFRLLLTAFLVVMLLPVGGLLASYHLWGNQNLVRSLQGQVQIATERDAQQIASVLDSFRHDAYLLSTNPDTIRILEEDPQRLSGEESRKIYAQMFLTMRSESSSAIANIVSNSGNVRLSTHEFPSDYDLRFHTNGWDVDNVLSQMENRSQTASMISIRGRQASNAGEPIIATIAIFSFTESKVLGNWTGFSTRLYANLFSGNMQGSSSLLSAVENTLLIALIAAAFSTLLGTVAAVGIHNLRGRTKQTVTFLNNIPMINPDIITGVSLFLLFVFLHVSQGYTTVVLAHITFCTPYVVLSVLPKLTQMNPNIYEAAMDLGATPTQALWKVLIPQLKPGMVSGFILAFTMSLDDFAVTFFTRGTIGLDTLSTFIYTDARKGGLTPELRPLMTLIFLIILVLLVVINVRQERLRNKKS